MMLDEAREESGAGGGNKANVFSFTAAISACGKSGHWQEAVRLLDVRDGGMSSASCTHALMLGHGVVVSLMWCERK